MMTFILSLQPLASWWISAHSVSDRDSAFVLELRNIFETGCSGLSIKDMQRTTTTHTEVRNPHITLKSGLCNENKNYWKNFKWSSRESATMYYKINSCVEVIHRWHSSEDWLPLSSLIRDPAMGSCPQPRIPWHLPVPSSPAPVILQQSWSPAPTALSCPAMPLVSQAHPYILVQPQPVTILRDVADTWSCPAGPGCQAAESVTRRGSSVRIPSCSASTPYAPRASSSPGLTPCPSPMSSPGLLNS